ncbi:unnamed protein product [Schistocephalus solidus]|uniref:Uncharacterized protein n=1 Tax=Schistocephalus solidus TaxID=70667 RepID=A0A183TIK4_SCHSO|nr:unnamed protein product [Schistocephalus solidus]
MFSAKLMDTYHDEHPGMRIAYRTDGHLLNSRRMQATTRVSRATSHDLLFADDRDGGHAKEHGPLRRRLRHLGLTINTVHQPPPSAEFNAPRINFDGTQLKILETFQAVTQHENRRQGCSTDLQSQSGLRPAAGLHVESPRYSPEHQTEDVQGRRLYDTPLRSGDLDRLLEPSQEAESLPSQLPPQNTEAEMDDRAPNTEVLERTGIRSIHAVQRQMQLRWALRVIADGEVKNDATRTL